jgi:hypothetical protein
MYAKHYYCTSPGSPKKMSLLSKRTKDQICDSPPRQQHSLRHGPSAKTQRIPPTSSVQGRHPLVERSSPFRSTLDISARLGVPQTYGRHPSPPPMYCTHVKDGNYPPMCSHAPTHHTHLFKPPFFQCKTRCSTNSSKLNVPSLSESNEHHT